MSKEILSKKEKTFCEEYLICGKKGEAAEKAGYKFPSEAASKLLKKEHIIKYVHELQAEACKQLHIDKNWAVIRALEVYEKCMHEKPLEKWNYNTHQMEETGEYVFDSKGAIKALELISKLLGLEEQDKVSDTGVIFIDDMGGGSD